MLEYIDDLNTEVTKELWDKWCKELIEKEQLADLEKQQALEKHVFDNVTETDSGISAF